MAEEKKTFLGFMASPLFQGILLALVIGLTGTLLSSLVFYLTSLSEGYLQACGTTIYLAGALAGGYLTARKTGSKGLICGCEVGVIYFLLFAILLRLFFQEAWSLPFLLLKGLYTVVVAAAGGIIGVALAE